MNAEWPCVMVVSALGLAILGLAVLEVVPAEPVRFDPRDVAALGPAAGAVRPAEVNLGKPGGSARHAREAGAWPWAVHLRAMGDALARNDVSAAERAWRDAYAAAFASRRWEGMIQVGDAARQIGGAAGVRRTGEAKARRLYLAALARARRQGSLEGVLGAGEAFAALGDREVVGQCLRIARLLAAQNPEAQADVRVFQERLAWLLEPPDSGSAPRTAVGSGPESGEAARAAMILP